MTYAILLLGVTTTFGNKVARHLALHTQNFSRIAVLTPEKEVSGASEGLERITGSLSDLDSYQGFDIVVSAFQDGPCAKQEEYMDAAFAGGVKHFYPAEYGADLTRPLVLDEPYFVDKIRVRKHLEARVETDPSLGYTYVMTGVHSDLLLEANILRLSKDKRSVTHIGHPDAKISITHSDDVAKVIATSLLPQHLYSLNSKRHIRFAGSTLPTASLFDAMSYVLHHPIDVTYQAMESSYEYNKQPEGLCNKLHQRLASLRRGLGLGIFELIEQDGGQPQNGGVVSSGREYVHELNPKNWAEVVHEYFMGENQQLAMMK